MKDQDHQQLNADLGFSFNNYVVRHPDWPLLEQVPPGATILFQTSDPGFNAWVQKIAEHTPQRRGSATPIVFVQVPELFRPPEQVDWERAEILTTAKQL
jgi:hypothetical protein